MTLDIKKFDELDNTQQEEIARARSFRGKVVDIRSEPNTDFVVFTTDLGETKHLHREEAVDRCQAFLQALENETGIADPANMDREVWMCERLFTACINNAKENNVPLVKKDIRWFYNRLRKVENTWREVAVLRKNRNKPKF